MQIDTNSKKVPATVAGMTLLMPQPFAEGYALLANEANAMNQLLTENLRNNIAGKMKAAEKEGKAWSETEAQAQLDTYAATYQFGARVGGIRSVDPVLRIMEQLAEGKVRELLKTKGIKLNTVDSDKMNSLIDQYIAKDDAAGGALRKIAEKRVKEDSKLAVAELDI